MNPPSPSPDAEKPQVRVPFFTVVLAGYRAAPYLPKALDSISGQTFKDFEAICYVERSDDASLALCRDRAGADPRFRVVDAPRSGAVATTRNYAITHARGEYLVVLDGDDWLAPTMLEEIFRRIGETGPVDVLAFAGVTVASPEDSWADAPKLANFSPADAGDVLSGPDAIRRAGHRGRGFCNHVVLSAYRIDFLRQHRLFQKDGMLMEDFEWTPRVWFLAGRIACLDRLFYAYRRRPDSLTTEASPRIAGDVVRHVRSLLDFAEGREVPSDILAIWANQWISLLYWFLFHPVTSRKIPDRVRREALSVLMADGGNSRLGRFVARASFPKRIAWPLVRLAANGIQFPAKFFFRRLYYPLAARHG